MLPPGELLIHSEVSGTHEVIVWADRHRSLFRATAESEADCLRTLSGRFMTLAFILENMAQREEHGDGG